MSVYHAELKEDGVESLTPGFMSIRKEDEYLYCRLTAASHSHWLLRAGRLSLLIDYSVQQLRTSLSTIVCI